METQRYRIVLTGEVVQGHDVEQVILAVAALFKQPPQTVRRLFGGKPVPLRQQLELAKAREVQARLHAAGARCTVEAVAESRSASAPPDGAKSQPASEVVPAPAPFACPKCGTTQEQGAACRKCGIVFAKWQAVNAAREAGAAMGKHESLRANADGRVPGGLPAVPSRTRQRNRLAVVGLGGFLLASAVAWYVVGGEPEAKQASAKAAVENIKQAGSRAGQEAQNVPEIAVSERAQTEVSDPSSAAGAGGWITLKVRDLLNARRFDELNALLLTYQAEAEADVSREEPLFTAYDAFQLRTERYVPLFDAWVSATPGAHPAHLARAKFYYRLAWMARGGRWGSETSKEQFTRMNEYFDLALRDVYSAMRLNEGTVVAYSLLLNIASAQGRDKESAVVLSKALKIAPASFYVRTAYLKGLAPRWGGSLEQMAAFASEAQALVGENPRLALLPGRVVAEAGDMKSLLKAYNVADELYTKAIELGEDHTVLFSRGKNRYRLERYEAAAADLDRAIELFPHDAEYYQWRSKVHAALAAYEKSVADIQLALRMNPDHEAFQEQRDRLASKLTREGYELGQSRKYSAALAKFDAAFELTPDSADLHQRRARVLIALNQHEPAIADLKRAIALDPDDYDSFHLLDWVLAKRGDWDQIISYWDRYIDRNPDDGRAYVERGGAYYRKGDLKTAVADAKSAADLGNAEGEEAYRRFSGKVR